METTKAVPRSESVDMFMADYCWQSSVNYLTCYITSHQSEEFIERCGVRDVDNLTEQGQTHVMLARALNQYKRSIGHGNKNALIDLLEESTRRCFSRDSGDYLEPMRVPSGFLELVESGRLSREDWSRVWFYFENAAINE